MSDDMKCYQDTPENQIKQLNKNLQREIDDNVRLISENTSLEIKVQELKSEIDCLSRQPTEGRTLAMTEYEERVMAGETPIEPCWCGNTNPSWLRFDEGGDLLPDADTYPVECKECGLEHINPDEWNKLQCALRIAQAAQVDKERLEKRIKELEKGTQELLTFLDNIRCGLAMSHANATCVYYKELGEHFTKLTALLKGDS